MKTKVGLWIDHRQAIVVAITEKGEEIKEILSEVEKQPQHSRFFSITLSLVLACLSPRAIDSYHKRTCTKGGKINELATI